MYEWYLQKSDGRVQRLSEQQLRELLQKSKLDGLELVRRADHQHWYPVHDTPLYAEEVAFQGAAIDHARRKVFRGFSIHLLSYLAVNVLVGFAAPIFLFWGIWIVLHGARAWPSAKALYDEGKLPFMTPKPAMVALPPRAPVTAPQPAVGPHASASSSTAPHAGVAIALPGAATDPFAPTTALRGHDPSASSSMPYDPTIGAGAARNLEDRHLHASVRGRLFGEAAAVPLRVGRYRLGDRLGAGGMGIVFRAHDESLDRAVALKLLRAEVDAQSGTERLQREARSMAKINHPNVVTVFDVGVFEGAVFVAMEFVDGSTLREWLTPARSVGDILATLRQAGEGLTAAHDGGLVHRDFKPENVIVGNDGRVRVLDFGLAKPIDEGATQDVLTRTGTVLGTPRYMAPEQFRGEPADALSDQFAFGVAVYEAIYGAHPYQPVDEMPLPRAVLKGLLRPPPVRSDVPTAIREAVVRGVAHDPAHRHPSIRAMLDAFGPIPTTTNELASLAAAVRRLLARRAGAEAVAMRDALDSIEATVAELDAKVALLADQTGDDVYAPIERERVSAQEQLQGAESDSDRALLQQQISALEQRQSGVDRAREVVARLRTRRSVAETQLKQLHLDLTRAEVSDMPLPDLSGPLQELRFQVDAAQEVEALLASRQ